MWSEIFDRRLDEIRAADRWRQLRPLTAGTGDTVLCDTGEHLVSFASNDYLGLSQHPSVRRAAVETIGRYGTGAGSSRLIVGSRSLHHELEHALAQHKKAEAALVFPTGYQANLGALGRSALHRRRCRS
ncbi:MAG: aminotransferase class I/II-fold pyridoxal phosphate-dependent enzyme [Acidimicrobiia bacterium]|nr:aminotransferase class I/II-fold pyridoxal phosphate-dependent enzyme [Acidimicrobiia bacterium]